MALTPLTGTATTTVKISDLNALITAINTELAALAASIATNQSAITAQGSRIKTVEDKPAPVIPPDLSNAVTALTARIDGLEAQPDPVIPPDLTIRVEALENLVQRVPAENPNPLFATETLPRPAHLPADQVSLIYDRATLYLNDMELHALRIGETTWRLVAQLNFVVVSPVTWTYDEVVEGTPDEVYRHAMARLQELAELKPQHDAVHERVRAMSEGRA